MDSTRFRRWWRIWFYAAAAIAGPAAVPSALDRPDAERIAFTTGWAVAALLYAALAWRTRSDQRSTTGLDVMTVGIFLLAALYEANWPGFRIGITPSAVGGIWAAAALGSSWRSWAMAKPPLESPASGS
jgi:hypothetical protein